MNEAIESQLDRVETALTTLINSIASYNPSIPAAEVLLVADDQLRIGLHQLAIHQRNHSRILNLHQRIAERNEQITSTVTSLADARNDLLSTPTSLPAKDTRSVPYTELLNYAKRISRQTIPPTLRPKPAPEIQPSPVPPTVNGASEPVNEIGEGGRGMGTEALEDEERKWLEPLMQIPFVPWVSEDVMKRGALAQIQGMLERGEDPTETKEVKADQSEDDMEELQDEIGLADEKVRTGERQIRKEDKPAVFGGLDLYDPDEAG